MKSDNNDEERKLLWQVLAINFSFFAFEMATGFISNSMGLVAVALVYLTRSKLPDLIVGLIIFIAVGRGSLRILQLLQGLEIEFPKPLKNVGISAV